MKSTGMVRAIDKVGRIVIPKEIRNSFRIKEGDPLEIFTDNNRIILQKYEPACMFCASAEDVVEFGDKRICKKCIDKIKNL